MLFKLIEFLIAKPRLIDKDIADKLYWYHIIPMIPVREALGVPMTASQSSGYRPKWWEFKKKRSGDSQHVFDGKGAVDWTCDDFQKNRKRLLELMIEHTKYTRFCLYDGFIHADYKHEVDGVRQLFHYNKESRKWLFIENVKA